MALCCNYGFVISDTLTCARRWLFAFFQSENKSPSLQEQDPEIYELITKEKHRQIHGIELIASEVSSIFMPFQIFRML